MEKVKLLDIFMIGLFLIISPSCEDYLDTESKTNLTDNTMWANETNADIYFNACIALLEPKWMKDQDDNFSDDFDTASGNCFASYFWKSGVVNASSDNFSRQGDTGIASNYANWPTTYTKIRKINTFIQKVEENSSNFSKEWMAKRLDEARFLRAYFYSELFIRTGGMVILTEPQNRTQDELELPRSTFEETFNFIVAELDTVINNGNLAVKYNHGDADGGRPTIGAALFLKGWIQLFAASPAYNSDDPACPDANNLQHFASYDVNRWKVAAETNKKFIDTYGPNGTGDYGLFSDMTKFWDEDQEYNKEVIWDKNCIGVTLPNSLNHYGVGPTWIHNVYYNWGDYNPTEELVQEYQMADGKNITDEGSGYNDQKPFVGRENRFYQFVCYDGASYKQNWMSETDTIRYRIDKVNPSKNEIDYKGTNKDGTKTGYDVLKRIDHYNNPSNYNNCGMNHVYYRYAEVLLNYAEAQNEAVGPDASVYEAINAIRTRPGTDLPELTPGLSQNEMRTAIRHERRIELMFEDKRIWDLLRWKIAEDVLNKPLHACKIANSSPDDNSGTWVITRPEIANMNHVFYQKMYFNPIPQSAIDRNQKLIQNYGY